MDYSFLSGYIYRMKNLPNSLLYIQKILNENGGFTPKANECKDGRISSAIQEECVLEFLQEKMPNRIKVPNARMWYDFLVYDYIYGWLPVDIKITTTYTSDNICNLAGLVHSYTSMELNFDCHYKNGEMSKSLMAYIKNGKINKKSKKDYFFVVINKKTGECNVNSILGLSELTPNINNLPFQVKWSKNKMFVYKSVLSCIDSFVSLFEDCKNDWKTEFIKDLGQYFTENKKLQQVVKNFTRTNTGTILEPSIGRGDLVSLFAPEREVDMYEIDNTIETLPMIDRNKIHFCDFLQEPIDKTYNCIVANPPYVKTVSGNLYKDFIEKCLNLLEKNGEMIFIVPSDFFQRTYCSELLTKMLLKGTFTDIFHPTNENLFSCANVNILVFRYVKNDQHKKTCMYNEVQKYINISNGIVTFDTKQKRLSINDVFHVKVGIVSGCEKVFKQPFGNVDVMSSSGKNERYILIYEFPDKNENINSILLQNKQVLLNRKIRKFTENNWFEFGALRNISFMKDNAGKKCIYINTMTRKKDVAFESVVGYFSANLLCLVPKDNVVDMAKFINYFNSEEFRWNYDYSGKFVIGQKQLESHLYN